MHCITTRNLEHVGLSVQTLWTGRKFLNLGHLTLTTPTLVVILLCIG